MDLSVVCLALAVYFEMRSEPPACQLAVAQVVVHRTESRRFPRSVCDVVFQRGQFAVPSDYLFTGVAKDRAWGAIYRLAERVWVRNLSDTVNDAVYFHRNDVLPAWAARLEPTKVTCNHTFYKYPEENKHE